MHDEKRALLEVAFPGRDWSDSEIDAMAEFVKVCTEAGYDDDMDDHGGDGEALLVFGGPKGKK